MGKTIFDATARKKSSSQTHGAQEADSHDSPPAPPARPESPASPSLNTDTAVVLDAATPDSGKPVSSPSQKHSRKHRLPVDYSAVLREDQAKNGWMGSYVSQPSRSSMHFETQHEKESILLLLRQHPIVLFPRVITLFALMVMPILIFPLLPFSLPIPPQMSFFGFIGWYIFCFIFAIESFLEWYYNIYIITDERIIDIDFYSLIYKSVSEAKVSRVEDVTARTLGVVGAALNYGNITIQTAAEKREFEFHKVPRPSRVTKLLNELILEEEREALEGRVM